MDAQPLADGKIWETHAYLKQLGRETLGASAASAPPGRISVDAASILASSRRPSEWLTFAGNYAGHRHSSLTGISKRNVGGLRVAWVAQLESAHAYLEASPIVASNLVFVTESPHRGDALGATRGRTVWQLRPPVPTRLPVCCG